MIIRLNKHVRSLFPPLVLSDLNTYSYVLNPSFLTYQAYYYLTIRMYCKDTLGIISKLYIWNDFGVFKVINLTNFFYEKLKLHKVADPKLFIMHHQVWCTFNTGYLDTNKNDIGLFNILDTAINSYFLCDYDKRQRIEKNWAFYYNNNQIYALYDVNSLTTLKGEIKGNHTLAFKFNSRIENSKIKGYSIGTPLFENKSSYLLIAHKKIVFFGKRMYLGKPFKIKLNAHSEIQPSRLFLFHSFKSLLGTKFKFNKNLISCTYFSGIHLEADNVILSYGVNDISWYIAKIKFYKLWR